MNKEMLAALGYEAVGFRPVSQSKHAALVVRWPMIAEEIAVELADGTVAKECPKHRRCIAERELMVALCRRVTDVMANADDQSSASLRFP